MEPPNYTYAPKGEFPRLKSPLQTYREQASLNILDYSTLQVPIKINDHYYSPPSQSGSPRNIQQSIEHSSISQDRSMLSFLSPDSKIEDEKVRKERSSEVNRTQNDLNRNRMRVMELTSKVASLEKGFLHEKEEKNESYEKLELNHKEMNRITKMLAIKEMENTTMKNKLEENNFTLFYKIRREYYTPPSCQAAPP